jgi:elongation factor 1-alpha
MSNLTQDVNDETNTNKEHISICVTGHVDSGKSTTTGNLIFSLGGIEKREMDKLQAEADAQNKSSFAFAYYMDKCKEERERGVTIQYTTKNFFTDSKYYTIVDCPGHKDFVKNMIRGASQADVALLMLPAAAGGFEIAIQKGDRKKNIIEGQTRQHARLLSLLGVNQLIVGVNKMDDKSVDWSETRYNEIRDEMQKMLKECGFAPKKVPIIPISGYLGDNLIKETDKMPWWKGWTANQSKEKSVSGVTLLDALDKFAYVPKRNADGAFRMPISGVLKIPGIGYVITGRIEQGTIRKDDVVGVCPRGISGCRVFSIEMHNAPWPEAGPGDNVGLNIKGLEKYKLTMPKEGDILYIEKQNKLKQVKSFRAYVMIQDHPGQLNAAKDGKKGYTPLIHVRTAKSACKMMKIHWKKGKKTGGLEVEDAPFVEKNEEAEITFEPQMPMFLEPFSCCEGLGRVAAMDSNNLVMLGKVLEVEYKEDDK